MNFDRWPFWYEFRLIIWFLSRFFGNVCCSKPPELIFSCFNIRHLFFFIRFTQINLWFSLFKLTFSKVTLLHHSWKFYDNSSTSTNETKGHLFNALYLLLSKVVVIAVITTVLLTISLSFLTFLNCSLCHSNSFVKCVTAVSKNSSS